MERYVDPTDQLVSEIFVRDIKLSTAFYRRLGFDVMEERDTFVELAWEGHKLFLDQQRTQEATPGFPQANIRVMVRNVDDYWSLAGEMRARVINPIANRLYGLRDFTIADPDGFGVRFGTRLEA